MDTTLATPEQIKDLLLSCYKKKEVVYLVDNDATVKAINKVNNKVVAINLCQAPAPSSTVAPAYMPECYLEERATVIKSVALSKQAPKIVLAFDHFKGKPRKQELKDFGDFLSNNKVDFISQDLQLGQATVEDYLFWVYTDPDNNKVDFFSYEGYNKAVERLYSAKYSAFAYQTEFCQNFTDKDRHKHFKTGFSKVDKLLNGGLTSGFYTFISTTGAGKTTFLLNMASRMAKQGTPVLYFSIEMSQDELLAKCLSSEMFQNNKINKRNLLSSLQILSVANGKYNYLTGEYEPYDKETLQALDQTQNIFFNTAGQNLYIFCNGKDEGVLNIEDIEEITNDFINKTKKPPVVMLDYLQILGKTDQQIKARVTDQQKIDDDSTRLKRLSNKARVPIIAISSTARMNYKTELDVSAGKGSGSIEYNSNMVFNLQPKDWDTKIYHKADDKIIFETDEERRTRVKGIIARNLWLEENNKPLEYELKASKSRFTTKTYQPIQFIFVGQYSHFKEV